MWWWLPPLIVPLLIGPHLIPRTQLRPVAGITLWSSVMIFRAVAAGCASLLFLVYFPASQLFALLNGWCLHVVIPLAAEHLGLSGHQVGDAASLAPASAIVASAALAAVGIWRAAHAVSRWLRRSIIGPGPHDSLLISGPGVIVAVAGMRAPRVVVSAEAIAELDEAELVAGLQHEWGHVRRLHRVVTLGASLMLAISRFIPGGSSAFRELTFHLERDADRYAVGATGNPLALASAICKVADSAEVGLRSAAFELGGDGRTCDRLRLLLAGGAFDGRMTHHAAAGMLALATLAATFALMVMSMMPAAAIAGTTAPYGLGSATAPTSSCGT